MENLPAWMKCDRCGHEDTAWCMSCKVKYPTSPYLNFTFKSVPPLPSWQTKLLRDYTLQDALDAMEAGFATIVRDGCHICQTNYDG